MTNADPHNVDPNLHGTRIRSRWTRHMTLVRDPLRTLSVSEPGGPGGCEKRRGVTAEQTAVAAGCLYAQNAGFFNGTSAQRLGDVVSDGRMVRDSGGQRNAQFGIRKDGSLVFGYLSQEDVLDRSNPFVQLVSGVVWLLRKGEIYINQSLKAEDVLSARTVVGHDADGDLILFHVDCVNGRRRCQQGWRGAACDSLVCRPPACGPHGVCSANGCVCDAGWRGKNCSQAEASLLMTESDCGRGGDEPLLSRCLSLQTRLDSARQPLENGRF
ncbi:N-acetylglucosamine-1-phosphodiester alpha-N-acetylglucosaminidase-like [Symphorus nematophorus]